MHAQAHESLLYHVEVVGESFGRCQGQQRETPHVNLSQTVVVAETIHEAVARALVYRAAIGHEAGVLERA